MHARVHADHGKGGQDGMGWNGAGTGNNRRGRTQGWNLEIDCVVHAISYADDATLSLPYWRVPCIMSMQTHTVSCLILLSYHIIPRCPALGRFSRSSTAPRTQPSKGEKCHARREAFGNIVPIYTWTTFPMQILQKVHGMTREMHSKSEACGHVRAGIERRYLKINRSLDLNLSFSSGRLAVELFKFEKRKCPSSIPDLRQPFNRTGAGNNRNPCVLSSLSNP